jgi:hypothetical protein
VAKQAGVARCGMGLGHRGWGKELCRCWTGSSGVARGGAGSNGGIELSLDLGVCAVCVGWVAHG